MCEGVGGGYKKPPSGEPSQSRSKVESRFNEIEKTKKNRGVVKVRVNLFIVS
jgi:hypothetical protein